MAFRLSRPDLNDLKSKTHRETWKNNLWNWIPDAPRSKEYKMTPWCLANMFSEYTLKLIKDIKCIWSEFKIISLRKWMLRKLLFDFSAFFTYRKTRSKVLLWFEHAMLYAILHKSRKFCAVFRVSEYFKGLPMFWIVFIKTRDFMALFLCSFNKTFIDYNKFSL